MNIRCRWIDHRLHGCPVIALEVNGNCVAKVHEKQYALISDDGQKETWFACESYADGVNKVNEKLEVKRG